MRPRVQRAPGLPRALSEGRAAPSVSEVANEIVSLGQNLCRENENPRRPRVRGDDETCSPQNCTCVRIAKALNFEPASPVLVALICLATVPCRKSNMKRTLPLMYQFSAAV